MPSIEPNPGKTGNAQVNPTRAALLGWDVFVTPGLPIVTLDLPPGVTQAYFQAMASTLIYGARDAVLVDAFMTVKQANALIWNDLVKYCFSCFLLPHFLFSFRLSLEGSASRGRGGYCDG